MTSCTLPYVHAVEEVRGVHIYRKEDSEHKLRSCEHKLRSCEHKLRSCEH